MLKSKLAGLLLTLPVAVNSLLPAPVRSDEVKTPVECRAVAKGKNYFVHAVPSYVSGSAASGLLSTPGPPPRATPVISGFSLVHTRLSTGAMRLLFAPTADSWTYIGGYNREYSSSTHLAGVAADAQRLYVLVREDTRATILIGTGRSTRARSDFVLRVFWCEDGSEIFSTLVKTQSAEAGEKLPALQPATPSALDAGPLQPMGNGISVYGRGFSFNGREHRETHPRKAIEKRIAPD